MKTIGLIIEKESIPAECTEKETKPTGETPDKQPQGTPKKPTKKQSKTQKPPKENEPPEINAEESTLETAEGTDDPEGTEEPENGAD